MRRHNIGFGAKPDSNTNVPFRGKSGHPKLKASHLPSIGDQRTFLLGLHASRRRATAQFANERVDLAALSFPFNCEQSHLRTAVGAGNREILKIRSRVVLVAHASDNPSASHERADCMAGYRISAAEGPPGPLGATWVGPSGDRRVAGFGLRPLPGY
jgi:hypothetical protein